MERRKEQAMTFYSPKVNKIKGDLKYQQPTLPTSKQSTSAQKRQQYLSEAYTYTRMLCASLSGFSLSLLICTSPVHWVQFLVTNNGLELNAGLWTLCNHELCWSHIPKPPYYLQYSRALFIISVLCELIGLGLFFNSCRPTERIVSSELDLKVSMLSFCSAICLLLCLNLFLAQVEWHTKSAMESELLWTYYLNWCSDVLSVCAGIISFLNYITFQSHPPDGSVSEDLQQKYRLGFGMAHKQIYYSDKYFNEQYEYRHVMLPREFSKQVPKTHLMSKEEWRRLGEQQSLGQVHYMTHEPEPHALPFR